ncbi:unnamed protein product [Protopolystoma xenopodis]|uniref:Uncharacterized protein n=1 Tax=Protopolystoma xenopodis TaxID=117903 RepID=A0A448XKA3_9PLAT|nr:unnamed protein product [Protopolystoma xenopodis]
MRPNYTVNTASIHDFQLEITSRNLGAPSHLAGTIERVIKRPIGQTHIPFTNLLDSELSNSVAALLLTPLHGWIGLLRPSFTAASNLATAEPNSDLSATHFATSEYDRPIHRPDVMQPDIQQKCNFKPDSGLAGPFVEQDQDEITLKTTGCCERADHNKWGRRIVRSSPRRRWRQHMRRCQHGAARKPDWKQWNTHFFNCYTNLRSTK